MKKTRRLLLFCYAFPPIKSQVSPVVAKAMANLSQNGFKIDILSIDHFSWWMEEDNSLLYYIDRYFHSIMRLKSDNCILLRIMNKYPFLYALLPDPMIIFQNKAYKKLRQMDLQNYDLIVTWSPFHSVNSIIAKLKQDYPNLQWLAQFSDPWARNPLEKRPYIKVWNILQERSVVSKMDYVVHSSDYARRLMMRQHPLTARPESEVLPHPFDDALYPRRPKKPNKQITLRYVGTLFKYRTPEPLFRALIKLIEYNPELENTLRVELIGSMEKKMLNSASASALPLGMVRNLPPVSYVESLEMMYDADILLLIEADVKKNLFMPSKLSDYIGTCNPIVGIVPPGGCETALRELGGWYANPKDIESIAQAIESAVNYVKNGSKPLWFNETYRQTFSGKEVGRRFKQIIDKITST